MATVTPHTHTTPTPLLTDIDTAHTSFLLICMALVQLMTPGLAFFYGGLCRKESVNTMMAQSFASMGIVTVVWFVVGFSLCFGHSFVSTEGLSIIGNPISFFCFSGLDGGAIVHPAIDGHDFHSADMNWVANVPGLVFAGYQGMFAVITPALMTGCFESRIRMQSQIYDRGWASLACFGKLWRARSRLYRSQILQVYTIVVHVNTRWKALAEIYTMHSFAPFWNP